MKHFCVTLLFTFLSLSAFSQQKNDVLLTIDGDPIYAQEFKQVYTKNLDLVQEEDQKSVDNYLNMFIDYKLKVEEAKAQGLDKSEEYLKDFKKYEEQLSRTYLYEDNVTEDVALEAYKRGLEELNVSHILMMCNWDAFPQDTLAAYNKIVEVRKKALAGEDFNELAKKYSEEPGANEREGKLGFFSVFDMVYPFETMAYETPIGEISGIVRTQFGYHILKVHERRPVLPKVSVSHIMISSRGDTTGVKSRERINEIYALIKQGESFDELAKQYSDDKNTGRNGGKMRPFRKGELKAPPFEEASYKLKKAGEISEPIQTRFGWHIIRLDKIHVSPTFEEEKTALERRIKDGERGKVITSAVTDKIKHKFGFKSYPYQEFFLNALTDSLFKRTWKYEPVSGDANKKIFTIGDSTYYYNDFGRYMEMRQGKVRPYKQHRTYMRITYDEFETTKIKEYFRKNLELENKDYAGVIREYREGLLIFDVMEENVWKKAKMDTIGQQAYYENNISKFQWSDRIEGAVFRTTNRSDMDKVIDFLKKGTSVEDIKAEMNTLTNVKVFITEGVFEKGSDDLPEGYQLKNGLSQIFESKGSFSIVKADKVLPAGPKQFDEVEGRVLSDYQNELEQQWMAELHKKYSVEVNKKVFKKLKEELGS